MPKALIVEDEPEANELLSMLVQLRGYQTESAFTGVEALAMVDRDRPDLVFLDLMLPDVNGFEVCRALKTNRDTSAIPVVMVTARLAADNRVQGFRVGATDYVPKPYTPDQIFASMDQAETWRKRLAEDRLEGQIPLDAQADVAPLCDITRLWSLLLDRTSLSEEAARGLDHTLVEVALRAIDWGRQRGLGLVATLGYACDSRSVVLTLRDQAGWFLDDSPRKPEGLGGLITKGQFDEVVYHETTDQVVMTRLFVPST